MSLQQLPPRAPSTCKRHSKENNSQHANTQQSQSTILLEKEIQILQTQLDNFKTSKSLREKELINQHTRQLEKLKAKHQGEIQTLIAQCEKLQTDKQRVQNINLSLTKKLNLLENKLNKSQKQIQGLVTVAGSKESLYGSKQMPKSGSIAKHFKKSTEKKKVQVEQDQAETGVMSYGNKDQDQVHHRFELFMRSLQEQNRSLKSRIAILEDERAHAQNTFEPLLRQSSEQVRTLIFEKNKYMVENTELRQQLNKLSADASHFEKAYKSLETQFTKLQKQYLVPTARDNVQTEDSRLQSLPILQAKLKELESDVSKKEDELIDLKAQKSNLQEYVRHLEATNRYLVGENKKILLSARNPTEQSCKAPGLLPK